MSHHHQTATGLIVLDIVLLWLALVSAGDGPHDPQYSIELVIPERSPISPWATLRSPIEEDNK